MFYLSAILKIIDLKHKGKYSYLSFLYVQDTFSDSLCT